MRPNTEKLNKPIPIKVNKGEEPVEVTKDILTKWKDRKWTKWDQAYWWIRHGIWQWLGDRPRKTRSFCQRGWRGWADEDIWGFYYYLSKVLLEGLKHLKKTKHGYPATLNPKTGEHDYDEKRWDSIMDEMIEGFELVRKCSKDDGPDDLEIGFNLTEEEKDKLNKSMQEDWPEWRLTTKEEEAKITRSFELFGKYFWSLWD